MSSLTFNFDVVVVGAGHAGTEAALAAAHGAAYHPADHERRCGGTDEL